MTQDPAAPPVSDDQLVLRVAGGDREAFAALFRRRQGDIYRFALHLTGRRSIAEDVTQDVFLLVTARPPTG